VTEPRYDVVWPLGRTVAQAETFAPRPASLEGLVVAELWDWLYEGDRAFALLREALTIRHPGISFVGYERFGNVMRGPEVLDVLPALLAEHGVDVAIAAVGHCGSCTPAVVRAALVAERCGVPAVSLVGEHFAPLARATALTHGVEGLALACTPDGSPTTRPTRSRRRCAARC